MMGKKETLSTTVDVKVSDYVKEVEREAGLEMTAIREDVEVRYTNMMAKLSDFQHQIDVLRQDIEAIKGNTTDKYSLTKAKLVKLMKDMGYTDG